MTTLAQSRTLFEPRLFVGTVAAAEPGRIRINLSDAGLPSSTVVDGSRYGLGVVGEFVLVEGEGNAQFGRIVDVRLPERERLVIDQRVGLEVQVHAIGVVQMLASISLVDLSVRAGVQSYPRLGARVFAAPLEFVSSIPRRMGPGDSQSPMTLRLGHLKDSVRALVEVSPEKIFGRHCAVLGATGGGKSYTVARLVEECRRIGGKVILLDPSGEYYTLGDQIRNVHLGSRLDRCTASVECVIPHESFSEGDFIALFQPAGKTQGPKLREAIRSLRLAGLRPELAEDGLIRKANRSKQDVLDALADSVVASSLESPSSSFDVTKLVAQIREECVFDSGGSWKEPDPSKWGGYEENSYNYCQTLLTRINGVVHSKELRCVFEPGTKKRLFEAIQDFLKSSDSALRISLEQLSFEFEAREIIANAIGRHFLVEARDGTFRTCPTVVILDEAHQFLNKSVGSEEYASRLDSFELIAKEGRKYALNICLATQRPRDIPEGVLSQMGTLIVHRLTNDRDREVVERACGEIDRSASAFLPNLEPGEAALVGVDLAIPLTIQIAMPSRPPDSSGPDFQKLWGQGRVPSSADNPAAVEARQAPARARTAKGVPAKRGTR